jgi:hypothetical protein
VNAPRVQPAIPLEGRLSDPDVLPRLLTWLGRGEWSGALAVRSSDVERRLYLADGRLSTVTSSDPGESLVSYLVATGQLDADEAEKAASHLKTQDRGTAFAKQLVGLSLLDNAAMRDGEQGRVFDTAATVLSLRVGEYRCEPGASPGEHVFQALEPAQLVVMAVLGRWDDTWALNTVGGMGAVLGLVVENLDLYEATGADEAYDLCFLRVDGQRSIAEVLECSPLPESAALRFLAAGLLLGCFEQCARAPATTPAPTKHSAAAAAAAAIATPLAPRADGGEIEEGDKTAPGFYRPNGQPGVKRPVLQGETKGAPAGAGRWLAIILTLGLLGLLGWAAFRGLSPQGSGAAGTESSP